MGETGAQESERRCEECGFAVVTEVDESDQRERGAGGGDDVDARSGGEELHRSIRPEPGEQQVDDEREEQRSDRHEEL